jgi:16S rRNA (uracil1498-N3)-methyltransferase
MQRFYVTFPLGIDLEIIDPDIHHQLTRVMRVKVWEHIVLFDGDSSETEYEIMSISKKSISLRGLGRKFPKTEGERSIALYQALPNKYEKIEYIIEKWVEIGIRRFIFFRSERSQKLILTDTKKKRFLAIAKEALEQCGGVTMPDIEFLDITPHHESWVINILLDTLGMPQKLTEMPQDREMALWVGPEGGWSDEERIKMERNSFISVRFSERILRTETAGLVVAFSLLYQ